MSRQWHEEHEKKKRSPKKDKNPFRGFVSHTPTASDKKDMRQYEITEDFPDNILPSLLSEGYKVGFSVDTRSGAYMAALTTKDADSLNHGLVLTARSGFGAFQAGLRVAFLHYIVFEEVWPDPTVLGDYVDEWDADPD